jgi:hypothetical protein
MDMHGKKKCGLAIRSGEVEPDAVEIYELDIEGGGPR